MSWNYRVFRCIDGNIAKSVYYEIRETHYDDAGKVNGWAVGAAWPMGETFGDLISDLGWFMASLSKPILDGETGLECEPAQMLADDLQKWIDARAEAKGEA
jgi:hypothetical protein